MNIAVVGNGRMGQMIDAVCAKGDELRVAGFVGPDACSSIDEIADIDAAIDFSYPGNLEALLGSAVRRRLPLVIGTTGLTAQQGDMIHAASAQIPIVWANNFPPA